MISITEAKEKIDENCQVLGVEKRPVQDSLDYVLFEDVISPIDLPGFRQSSMDGFALRREDLENGIREFNVVSEIQAGPSESLIFKSGEAARIFTGAKVPDCADIVVIQEKTEYSEPNLKILEYSSNLKSNIRSTGEQIEKGSVALVKGHEINPSSVGFMCSMGIQNIDVFRRPNVAMITTGNELKKAGSDLLPGEIYESNSSMMAAALVQNNFVIKEEKRIEDTLKESIRQVKLSLAENDVLIISGGISVGKYDFVKRALEENGVEEVFYKIRQKPGKPMYFGTKDGKLIFALPGNPASLLTCFYIYLLPALSKISGRKVVAGATIKKLTSSFEYRGDRPVFLKAHATEDSVEILEGQMSFVLKSFAEANALVYLHGENRMIEKGSEVEVIPIT